MFGGATMKYLVSSLVLMGLMLQVVSAARAQTTEIALLSPNPIEATINKLTADFEAKTGIHVKITYGTGVSTRKTVASGQALDVSLLFAPFPEALKTGNIDPKSATVIGRLRLAIGVRKGRAEAGHLNTRRRQAHAAKREVHRLRGSGTGERRWCGAPDARQARDHAGVEAEDQVGADRRRRAGRGGERRCRDRVRPLSQRHAQSRVGCRRRAAARGIDARGHHRVSIHERERSQSGASAAGLPLITGGCAGLREREDLSGAVIAARYRIGELGERLDGVIPPALLLRLCSERCGGNGLCIVRTGLYRRLRPAYGASHVVLGSSSL